ncbi:MAG: hypothetical protein HRU24_07785 [Gammaproteobacteria bacterium]|nr:hypothetical protein [Gammaproteobacteria bacterium]
MAQPLAILEQKFKPPQQWVKITQRLSLLDLLMANQHVKLTTLISPAGFGKSTLLAQFLMNLEQKSDNKVVWVSLDPSDDEPNQFINLLSHALFYHGLVDQSFITKANSLSASRDFETWRHQVIQALINSQPQLYLFFDDFQFISNPVITQFIDFLTQYSDNNVHIVISSRIQPLLSTSHLMVTGKWLNIGYDQLTFSALECQDLLKNAYSVEQIDELFSRTEGWPVAIQLVLLWQQQHPNDNIAQLLTTNTETLNDYMSQQIFATLSPEIKNFLIKTAFLDRFDIELANYVCEIENSRQILEQLRGHQSLVIPLDIGATYFRYHHLFSDFLQLTSLSQLGQTSSNALRCRAAVYYAKQLHLNEAVGQCIRAKNPSLAIELINQSNGWEMILMRGIGFVESLLANFNQEQLTNSPSLGLMQSYLSLKLGNVAMANQQLAIAKAVYVEQLNEPELSGITERDLLLMDIINETYLDHAIKQSTITSLTHNLDQLAEHDHLARGIIFACLALIYNQLGEFANAQPMAEYGEQEMRLANCWVGLSYSQIHHAQSLAYRGLSQQAQQQFKQASELAQQHLGIDNGLKSMIHCLMAELHYHQHQHGQAQQLLNQEIAILEDKDCWHDIYAVSFKLAINLAIAQQDQLLAVQFLARGYQVAQQRDLSRLSKLLDVLKLKISIIFNDIDQFNQTNSLIIREQYWQEPTAMWQIITEYYWVMTLHYLSKNISNQCLNYCKKLAELASRTQQNIYIIRVHSVEALLLWQAKKIPQAIDKLQIVLPIAQQHGITTVFFELPPLIGRLLAELKQQAKTLTLAQSQINFIDTLLEQLQQQQLSDFDKLGLSQREQQIAPYLITGMTNKQISLQLGISDNTVKFHLKNLFVKLNVTNRNEAMTILVASQS